MCPNGACVLVADTELERFSLALCVSRNGIEPGKARCGGKGSVIVIKSYSLTAEKFWAFKDRGT